MIALINRQILISNNIKNKISNNGNYKSNVKLNIKNKFNITIKNINRKLFL